MAKREIDRDTELSSRAYIRHKLLKVFEAVDKAAIDQRGRSDDIMDFWDAYNCKIGERQFYSGNSHIYVPIIKTAVKARKTRFSNQIFPQSGRFVEVTTTDGEIPHATMALAEHYVKRTKLRTQIVPALIANGDCEGQYTVYAGWSDRKRHVARRVQKPVVVDGLEIPGEEPVDDIEEEEVTDSGPDVELIHDSDLIVIPATANSIEDAVAKGGSVTVVRRWTEAKVKEMIADGSFTKEAGEPLLKNFGSKKDAIKDTGKELSKAAGLKDGGGGKYVMGYETWTRLKVDGQMRLCVAYYGGHDMVLGCKLNPYWCDLCPVISTPVDKQGDVFKGRAPIADVLDMQIDANDAMNEAADTAHFSAMPIIMTDPEKNPRVGTMVLGLAAIWETNPKDTQFAKFPELWKDGLERVAAAKNEIFQSLGVNPAMVPQSTGKSKRNQAEIANEQQVDILTTADAVTNIEEGILTPLVQRFILYDHQFRNKPMMIRRYGEMGMRAIMEEVPPVQELERYEFRWFGVEAARNAAQIQQQIATLNVLKGIPPQMYQGYRLNAVPVITQIVENTFGPRLAPLVFEDLKKQIGIPPEMENQMLAEGFDMMVHPFDDDMAHIQAHMPLLSMGDPSGVVRAHLVRHQQQMQMKAQQAQQQGGMPGTPGGAGPGVAGTPRPGAQPAGPRQMKQPEGSVRQDAMPRAGAVPMPRKM